MKQEQQIGQLPKISIITVCYNSEATIEETVRSVIAQDYPAKEFIIIDGKSKDRTMDILSRYSNEITILISEPDKGIPDALNKGIARATGEWLYFLSSDDLFYNDHVLKEIFSVPQDADMIYGNVIMKTTDVKYDGVFDLVKILKKNICHQAQFYRKHIFEKIGNYNVNYKLLSDYDHTLRIFADERLRIRYVDRIIALFNDTGRTAYQIDHRFWRDRRQNFMERFRQRMPSRQIAKSYELYFYQNFKAGSIIQGVKVLLELLYYTRDRTYINAAIKNLYYRLKGYA